MTPRIPRFVRGLAAGLALQTPPAAIHRCTPGSASACLSTSVDLPPAALKQLVALDSAELASGWRGRMPGGKDLFAFGRPASLTDRDERLLVLLDVSGSMKGAKIGAARLVLREFIDQLAALHAKSVRVAVAPFGSIDVATRIDGAAFVPLDSARFAIDRLPSPGRENTALYSAIALGAKRLGQEVRRAGSGATGLLLVITDGDNDVGRGDDPGLLTGQAGLRAAAGAMDESRGWLGLVAIGALDQRALAQLAAARGSVFSVPSTPSAFQLSEPLARLRRVLQNRWDVQFRMGPTGRTELARRAALLTVEVGSGPTWTTAATAAWRPPFVALPAYLPPPSGIGADPVGPGAGLTGGLTLSLPLAFLALLLIQLWIVIPRLLWPVTEVAAASAPRSVVIRPMESRSGATVVEPAPAVAPVVRPFASAADAATVVPSSAPNVRPPASAADAPTVVPPGPSPRIAPQPPGSANAEAPPRKPTDVTASKARRG